VSVDGRHQHFCPRGRGRSCSRMRRDERSLPSSLSSLLPDRVRSPHESPPTTLEAKPAGKSCVVLLRSSLSNLGVVVRSLHSRSERHVRLVLHCLLIPPADSPRIISWLAERSLWASWMSFRAQAQGVVKVKGNEIKHPPCRFMISSYNEFSCE
jgi:hypothetical protein